MTEGITPRVSGKQVEHLDEADLAELSEHLAFACRQAGLRNHALDCALAGALSHVVSVIKAERGTDAQRRSNIRQVK